VNNIRFYLSKDYRYVLLSPRQNGVYKSKWLGV